jgi:molybdopterin-guanine dinucleotide biosynthesis protein A
MRASRALPPLAAGLLVGGAGLRMGRPKALVELGGVPLAARVAAAVAAVAPELFLLGAGEVPEALAGRPRLSDAPGVAGPLAGLLAALRAAPERAWLLVACDQALASSAACRWLARERAAERIAILPRLVPERIEPLLAIYEPAALGELERMAAAGELSLQPLARVAGVATPAPPSALAAAWTSVDTPELLAELECGARPPFA